MMFFALAADLPTTLFGRDVGIRIFQANGEIVQELSAKGSDGAYHPILVSPTHPAVRAGQPQSSASAVAVPSGGLFTSLPTFLFTDAQVDRGARTVTLRGGGDRAKVVETISIPVTGNLVDVRLHVHMTAPNPVIDHLLATYAFFPGTPDTTWAPGLRNQPGRVIGDHFFRSPAVVAQKGPFSAALVPDLDELAAHRPIPTIVDLDCRSEAANRPLLSYGFADYRLVAHVAFAHDDSMARAVPANLSLGFQIRLDANTPAAAAYAPVADLMWRRYGHRYLDKILPQAMPFSDYARYCYPAAFAEKDTGGWFERTLDGEVCGGLPSGWGLDQGWVSWQAWFNQVRSAWGLRWWGKKLGNADWVARSDKMLNLALAAPMHDGACPTTFESRTGTWRGSLIAPTPPATTT